LEKPSITINESEHAPEQNPTPSDDAAVIAMETGDFVPDVNEELDLVRLPTDGVNACRTIPGVCTICLCAYEDGDQISWSTEESCQHAFHTDCIVPWLAKKEEPRCPVCRQEFCPAAVVPDDGFDFDLERENSFLQSFSHALALSQLYRPFSVESGNNGDQTRSSITLQLANIATEQQGANPERPMPSSAPESELEISPVAAETIVDSNDIVHRT
jgi:Ring finger domain